MTTPTRTRPHKRYRATKRDLLAQILERLERLERLESEPLVVKLDTGTIKSAVISRPRIRKVKGFDEGVKDGSQVGQLGEQSLDDSVEHEAPSLADLDDGTVNVGLDALQDVERPGLVELVHGTSPSSVGGSSEGRRGGVSSLLRRAVRRWSR